MDVSDYHYADSISIGRPPDDVYEIVSDVTRIGELSPVCQAGTWKDPANAANEGAWFTGHNAIDDYTWDTRCEVVAAQPGREFAFINHGPEGDAELVRWGFLLEAEGDGTRVTENWQVLPAYPDFVTAGDATLDVKARIDGMAQMARDGISGTLANLKRVAETST
jgi:carbon monoxide dehydrogenase subunit G